MSKLLTEKVICPSCDNIIDGEIKRFNSFPFDAYYGHCDKCDYNITESDWHPLPDADKQEA